MTEQRFPVLEGEVVVRGDSIRIDTSKLTRARNVVANSLLVQILLVLILLFVVVSLVVNEGPFSRQRFGSTILLIAVSSVLVIGGSYFVALLGDTSNEDEIRFDEITRVAVKERGSIRSPLLVLEYASENDGTKYRPIALRPSWFDERTSPEALLSRLESRGLTVEQNPTWE